MEPTRKVMKTWDATIPASEPGNQEVVMKFFEKNCSKWIFQKEKGEEGGYEHFQCRFTLRRKTRFVNLRERMVEELGITGFSISPTSKNCLRKDEEYYVTKEETRIDGPWRSEADNGIDDYWKKAVLRDWQSEIVKEIESYVPEGRKINLIVNTKGNEGKSFLANYLRAHGRIYIIPPLDEYKDIMQFMMCMYKENKPVFVDVPRGLSGDTKAKFFSALETIKGGYLYDMRYRGRDRVIAPPCMYIFCNVYPDRNLLSWDRWHVRKLEDGKLTDTYLFKKKK